MDNLEREEDGNIKGGQAGGRPFHRQILEYRFMNFNFEKRRNARQTTKGSSIHVKGIREEALRSSSRTRDPLPPPRSLRLPPALPCHLVI